MRYIVSYILKKDFTPQTYKGEVNIFCVIYSPAEQLYPCNLKDMLHDLKENNYIKPGMIVKAVDVRHEKMSVLQTVVNIGQRSDNE